MDRRKVRRHAACRGMPRASSWAGAAPQPRPRPCAPDCAAGRKPPRTEMDWGVRPTWPITATPASTTACTALTRLLQGRAGMGGWLAGPSGAGQVAGPGTAPRCACCERPRPCLPLQAGPHLNPPSILTASMCPSFIMRIAPRTACSGLTSTAAARAGAGAGPRAELGGRQGHLAPLRSATPQRRPARPWTAAACAQRTRPKGHVSHQKGAVRAARHGLAVAQHLVHSHRQRGVVAVHHHGHAVAHQQHVDPRLVHLGGGSVARAAQGESTRAARPRAGQHPGLQQAQRRPPPGLRRGSAKGCWCDQCTPASLTCTAEG